MKIISRSDAITKGLKRYFTGEACKRGHISERRVINFSCLECHKENQSSLLKLDDEYKDRQKTASKKWKLSLQGKTWQKLYQEKYSLQKPKDKDKEKERLRLLMRKKRKTDIQYRIKSAISSQINFHMKKGGKSTSKLLSERCGYTIKELMVHLERQFTDSMTWKNYGKSGWHIDHIVPASSFDLTKISEFKACWSLGNLRPLWAMDNAKKSAKHTHLI